MREQAEVLINDEFLSTINFVKSKPGQNSAKICMKIFAKSQGINLPAYVGVTPFSNRKKPYLSFSFPGLLFFQGGKIPNFLAKGSRF